jgi:hypothetical protein
MISLHVFLQIAIHEFYRYSPKSGEQVIGRPIGTEMLAPFCKKVS